MNIFLIGYRCTGKTGVGKLLADRLGLTFVDADEVLVREIGMSIAELVKEKGWPAFRQKEREVMCRLCRQKNQVVATGGGVILDPENVTDMKQSGKVVWLTASPETILERMAGDEKTEGQRPSLTDKGVRAEVRETLKERLPLYEAAGDVEIGTDGATVAEVVYFIENLVSNHSLLT